MYNYVSIFYVSNRCSSWLIKKYLFHIFIIIIKIYIISLSFLKLMYLSFLKLCVGTVLELSDIQQIFIELDTSLKHVLRVAMIKSGSECQRF